MAGRNTNDMKRILYIIGMAAALASCIESEDLGTQPQDRQPITVTVTDGGYAAADKSGTDTRAVDNGYATTFTAGDQIGLYIVKSDGTYAAENIPLTLTVNGSGMLAWQAPASTKLYYEGAAAKYFAYYPYQQTLPAVSNTSAEPVKPDASATDASGFFAPLISAWTPTTDQGTHAKYTAQDLMIGSGTPGKKENDEYSLTFSMTHAMALVVIETPMTKYTLTDKDGNPLPDYCIPAPDTRFYGFTPYNPSLATYRYLVKPAQSGAADLMGSYTATGSDGSSSATKEYAVSPSGITAANYALYKVDGGATTVISKSHTLKVGDFYMNDGSLLAGSTEILTDAQKKACIGIIYSTDANRIGNATKEALMQKDVTPHGLVMALTNASEQCQWGEYGRDENNDGTGPFQSNTSTLQAQYNNVDGYGETHWILDNYKDNSTTLMGTYSAFYHASRYGATEGETFQYAAPVNTTTGWFIPSMGQWWDILSNLGGIDLSGYKMDSGDNIYIPGAAETAVGNMNRYLEKIDGATKFSINTFFWSSSEFSSANACAVGFNSSGDLRLYYSSKYHSIFKVRCVFAF